MTKRRKRLPLILGILFLTACLGLGGFQLYQNRFSFVGEERYEKTIESIDLSGQTVADLTQLQAFPGLKQIDLRDTGLTCDEYDLVKSWFPDADILWDIPFRSEYYDMDTESLTITDLSEEDMAVLPYFTALKSIDATNFRDYARINELKDRYPQLEVNYGIWLEDQSYAPDVTELQLANADIYQLEEVLPFFTRLEHVSFAGTLPAAENLKRLTQRYPDIEFYWQITVLGAVAEVYTTELDFSGVPMTATEELEAAVAYLPSLEKVLMLDCGLSNEEMHALNQRHENVLFVWNVVLNNLITLRSDATTFAPVVFGLHVWDEDLVNLKYCTELVVIDLGHMEITKCDFLAEMTKLEYLILVDTYITDISPVSNLKNLKFLEIFMSPVMDYTPLLGCTALEDLNICYTRGNPKTLEQMTWLKRLWVQRGGMSNEQYASLIAALPNTQVVMPFYGSTSDGWRQGYLYYEMRDLLGMPYLE